MSVCMCVRENVYVNEGLDSSLMYIHARIHHTNTHFTLTPAVAHKPVLASLRIDTPPYNGHLMVDVCHALRLRVNT
jgi:hypothetical protein